MRMSALAALMYVAIAIICCVSVTALAQTDAEKLAEGRLAFDTYKNCPAALRAFTAVSEAGRQSPMWVYYMGKTHECLGNTEQAIGYYRKYNTLVPGQQEVLEKIAELQYTSNNPLPLLRDLVNLSRTQSGEKVLGTDTWEFTRERKITNFNKCTIYSTTKYTEKKKGIRQMLEIYETEILTECITPLQYINNNIKSQNGTIIVTTINGKKSINCSREITNFTKYTGRGKPETEVKDISIDQISFFIGEEEEARKAASLLSSAIKICVKTP